MKRISTTVLVGLIMLSGSARCDEVKQVEEAGPNYASCIENAKNGDPLSQYQLSESFRHGWGTNKDLSKAFEWCRRAAEQGFASAQARLGLYYYHGRGTATNIEESLVWHRKAAEQGIVYAQLLLGVSYATGDGVPTNKVAAVKWLRKAAMQDEEVKFAQLMLAKIYERGDGVDVDKSMAAKLYRKAGKIKKAKKIERELNRADYDWIWLGVWLIICLIMVCVKRLFCFVVCGHVWERHVKRGKGNLTYLLVSKTVVEEREKQYKFGLCYYFGLGVKKNMAKAIEEWSKASDSGCDEAQYVLACCYEFGRGVPRNQDEAAALYLKASENGNTNAQRRLAKLYEHGWRIPERTVPENKAAAAYWYQQAGDKKKAAALTNPTKLRRVVDWLNDLVS